MKTKFLFSTSISILIVCLFFSCRKKEDGSLTFDHHVISMTMYTGTVLVSKSTIDYDGEKMTKISTTGYSSTGAVSSTSTSTVTYPTEKSIHVVANSPGSQSPGQTTDITLENNRPVQCIEDYGPSSKYKTEITYNSDGTVNTVSNYDYSSSWILSLKSTYIYSSGKLTQVTEIEYSGTSTYENKYVYTYSGSKIQEVVFSARWWDGTWHEDSKNVYTYNGDLVTSNSSFYKSGSSWILDHTSNYSYDNDKNLVSELVDNYRTDYAYEDGKGNFLVFFQALGVAGNEGTPTPHKKSQSVLGALNNIF